MSTWTPLPLQASRKVSWGQVIAVRRWDKLLEMHSSTEAWKTEPAERLAAQDHYLSNIIPCFEHFTALPMELQVEIVEYLDYDDLKRLA